MSKRANESSLEFIVKKLRKLEKEVKRSRQEKRDSFTLSSTSSSSQSSESLSNSSRSATSQGIIAIGEEATSIPMDHNDTIPLEQPTPVENNEQNVVSDNVSGDPIASSVHDEGAANAEILDILGADPSVAIEYGPDINKDVATRFTHVATVGLNKDVRKELLKKFLVPGNCTNIAAPQLNAEIKATVSEQVVKRDKAIEARQKQIAAGISSLGKIISDQLCATEKNNDLIRDLMELGLKARNSQETKSFHIGKYIWQEFKLEGEGRDSQAADGPAAASPSACPAERAASRELVARLHAATQADSPPIDPQWQHPNQHYPGCRGLIRTALLQRCVPVSAVEIMMASWSSNTLKQYNVYLKRWYDFCTENSVNIYEPSIPIVIEFLTQIFNNGGQYRTINSYRAALSLIVGNMSDDDRITRFCKGVYKLRPPLPRYNTTWDTNIVLNHLGSLAPNDSLTLEQLSKKCTTLLALVTAHRVQTLSKIKTDQVIISNDQIMIRITDLIKTSRAGTRQPILYLPFFKERSEICPAETLIVYMDRTKNLRNSDKLFISVRKPHNCVSPQTLSRWIKIVELTSLCFRPTVPDTPQHPWRLSLASI
ncbi:uncharacterized protein LOC120636991 [Pararge aegeria]|uniref:uncharacterized protein LOC120636991 n=1 Tax=Pararge aegeria TaxID=116150 RepID=UPI0019CFDCCC|nr:uncharacterized protein LOC120636991 [Pararge aegeria]